MGNQGSKPARRSHGESLPEMRRSDTQTSTRSGRSIMSNRSSWSAGAQGLSGSAVDTSDVPGDHEHVRSGLEAPPSLGNRRRPSSNSMTSMQTMHSARSHIDPSQIHDVSNSGEGGSNANPSSYSHSPGHVLGSLAPNSGSEPVSIPSDADDASLQRELPFGASPRGDGSPTVLFGTGGDINIDDTIQLLLDVGYSGKTPRNFCLKSSEINQICRAARDIFLSQPPLLELSPPVKVVGDVHGQYGDLLRLFGMCGFPPQSNYLFLGDYVDRGKQSLETILLLLCYKIKHPENFFLLRGNHESASVTRIYGFYDECKRRSSMKTWRTIIDTFNTLPIAAIVAQKIFCVHGGLSPSLTSINEIKALERPTDVPEYGLLNDLLWSDPTDGPNEWEDNERGVSYCYNKVAINKFLQRFGFDLVCRAHMVVEDGYEFFNDRSLVTVFSAPNYCGEFDNWGAAMSVSEELLCSFELLKPLDSAALKEEMRREKHERKALR